MTHGRFGREADLARTEEIRARVLDDKQFEAARAARRRKEIAMTTTKTTFGDRVQLFPSTETLRDAVAELREELGALFDEAAEAADRQARMNESKADHAAGRDWPVLNGQ